MANVVQPTRRKAGTASLRGPVAASLRTWAGRGPRSGTRARAASIHGQDTHAAFHGRAPMLLGGFDLLFDSVDVAAAEGFDFAAELEVAADLVVGEDAEAIDDRQRAAGPLDHVVGVEL
jgi:hypothetical protein